MSSSNSVPKKFSKYLKGSLILSISGNANCHGGTELLETNSF